MPAFLSFLSYLIPDALQKNHLLWNPTDENRFKLQYLYVFSKLYFGISQNVYGDIAYGRAGVKGVFHSLPLLGGTPPPPKHSLKNRLSPDEQMGYYLKKHTQSEFRRQPRWVPYIWYKWQFFLRNAQANSVGTRAGSPTVGTNGSWGAYLKYCSKEWGPGIRSLSRGHVYFVFYILFCYYFLHVVRGTPWGGRGRGG
jgi:hypothetical protein